MQDKYQGPIFVVGEVLEIKGGKFRVSSFGKKMIVLEGLPGTHTVEAHKVLRALTDKYEELKILKAEQEVQNAKFRATL